MSRIDVANELMGIITIYAGHKCGWPDSVVCFEHGSCLDVKRIIAAITALVPEWNWRDCPYIGMEARKP